jgi:2-dehydro-3-deoxyphosphogalactonate aldolase
VTGLIAILRGVTPAEVVDIGRALAEAGIAAIEVPLNSPDPFTSVRLLDDALGDRCAIGARSARAPCSRRTTSGEPGKPVPR